MKFKRAATLIFTGLFAFVSVATTMEATVNAMAAEGKEQEETQTASDIAGHWAANTLSDFQKKGYLKGDENGKVFPDKNMSRAEYASVINRVMEFSEESPEISKFTDVKADDWYRADLAKALKAGYMKGTGKTTMSPLSTVTREQGFVMLYRLTYPNGAEGKKKADLKDFADSAEISDYAKEAISVLIGEGVIKGYNAKIAPKQDISKAQAVLAFSRSMDKLTAIVKAQSEQEFTGTGAGYGGTMKLKVIFDKGKIVDIKIISEHETSSYLRMAKAIIAQIIAKQGVEGVDNISGATLTCNAIKDAVKDCISQQKGQGSIGTVGSTGSKKRGLAVVKKDVDFADLTDGEYSGSADGYRSNSMSVTVTVKDGKIIKIEYKNGDDAGYLSDKGAKRIIQQIIDKQSTKVDTVSGATKSSIGLVNAVVDALETAASVKVLKNDFIGNDKRFSEVRIVSGIKGEKFDTIGDLIIAENVADGNVELKNIKVGKNLIIKGGGSNSVHLENVEVKGKTIIDKTATGQKVRLVVKGKNSSVKNVELKTPAIVHTEGSAEIEKVKLPEKLDTKEEITIKAKIKQLDIRSSKVVVKVEKGSSVENIEVPGEDKIGKCVLSNGKYEGNDKKFQLTVEQENEVKNVSNFSLKDGTYYGEGYGFSKAERLSKNGVKGFEFPKKNIAKVVIKNGKVKDAAIELFVDDDESGMNYTKGSNNVVNYVKSKPVEDVYEKFISSESTKEIVGVDAVTGSTRSADGFRAAFAKALEDARQGKKQKYKGFWLIKAPGKLVAHTLTAEEQAELNKITKEEERKKFEEDHAFESQPQYFGEKIALEPVELRLIPVDANLPAHIANNSDRENALNAGEKIELGDFSSKGIEVFVTDKKGNRVDVGKPIQKPNASTNRADYMIHWLHKESGMEILKAVQFCVKPAYVDVAKIRLILKNKKTKDLTNQDIQLKTGKDGDFFYDNIEVDLAHNELEDIELLKTDDSKVALKTEGDKHYTKGTTSGKTYWDIYVADEEKAKLQNGETFQFDKYRVIYRAKEVPLTKEEQKEIVKLEYKTGLKTSFEVGEKFAIENLSMKLVARNAAKYSIDISSSNYQTYLKFIRPDGTEFSVGDVITDKDSDIGDMTLKVVYRENANVVYEYNVEIKKATVADHVPAYLKISKNGNEVRIDLKSLDDQATYKLSKEQLALLGNDLGKIQPDDVKFYNSSDGEVSHVDVGVDVNKKRTRKGFTINAMLIAIYAKYDGNLFSVLKNGATTIKIQK